MDLKTFLGRRRSAEAAPKEPGLSSAESPQTHWERSESLLDGIDLPSPFTVDGMVNSVAAHIGGTIQIRDVHLEGDAPCGMWLALGKVNYIFVDARSHIHRDHIILHELAHMICGHNNGQMDLAGFLPGIDPSRIHTVLARSGYNDHQEAEAEIMATVIARRRWDGDNGSLGGAQPLSAFERTLR